MHKHSCTKRSSLSHDAILDACRRAHGGLNSPATRTLKARHTYVRLRSAHRDYITTQIGDDALIELDIQRGDLLLVEKTSQVIKGELAMVKTRDGTLVRFYFPEPNGWVRLEPCNPDYSTRWYTASEVSLFGRVVKLERSQAEQRSVQR